MAHSRRDFLSFIAVASATSLLPACRTSSKKAPPPPFLSLTPTTEDLLKLAPGFEWKPLLRWRDPLNREGARFGFNNDYLAYIPLSKATPLEGLLWVNHEYSDPYYNSGWRPGQPRTKEQIEIERREVGGSIVHIKNSGGTWDYVKNSKYNRRLDAFTKIPFVSPVLGKKEAIGTFAGCAGGITPWGTILSAEENYYNFIGEVDYSTGKRELKPNPNYLSWEEHAKLPPEHYGWIVEVNLKTGAAKKLTAMGRFSHECATCVLAQDGRTVVYSGDDAEFEHLYKFISDKPGSLDTGELFVADTVNGRWLSLDREKDDRLKAAFKDQMDLLVQASRAAKIVGATPLDRPEDVEIQPSTGTVFVSLSLNKKNGNFFGSLLKIEEKNADPLSLEFKASTYVAGGEDFSCPDNLAFDARGNLWMTSDISGSSVRRAPYNKFGNNGLFYIPLSGEHAGRAFQVASAPVGAEFTGPFFAPDGKTLFLSVQHPGERGHTDNHFPSHWPDGPGHDPAPCVVQIQGPMMEQLLKG